MRQTQWWGERRDSLTNLPKLFGELGAAERSVLQHPAGCQTSPWWFQHAGWLGDTLLEWKLLLFGASPGASQMLFPSCQGRLASWWLKTAFYEILGLPGGVMVRSDRGRGLLLWCFKRKSLVRVNSCSPSTCRLVRRVVCRMLSILRLENSITMDRVLTSGVRLELAIFLTTWH